MSSDPIGGPLLLQVILIAINAYFASTEIAVLSLNDVKIRRQAEEGDRVAKLLMKLAENPNRFLSTIQVGITPGGLPGQRLCRGKLCQRAGRGDSGRGRHRGSAAAQYPVRHCHYADTFVLHPGAGRAGAQAHRHAAARARGADELQVHPGPGGFLPPVVWLLSKSTNGVLRLLGMNPNAEPEEVTEEEIRAHGGHGRRERRH